MQLPTWMRSSPKSRRHAISKAERRRRDELLIPLEVGRLEERRVLSASPAFTGTPKNLTGITQDGTNTGTTVSTLISGKTSNASGIAITSMSSGTGAGGTWQYDNSGIWTAIPAPGSQAFALLDADSIRFDPNPGFSGNSASITYLAWDGSGSDQTLLTINSSNFSSAGSPSTETSTIDVSPPAGPQLANDGNGGSQPILDDQATKPFDNTATEISVNETDLSDTLTVTVTQNIAANGTLSGGNFSPQGGGEYLISGVTAAQATLDLDALTFTPNRGTAGTTVNTSFSLSVTDLYAQSAGPVSAVVATTGNVTPVLKGTSDFAPIPENSTSSSVTGTAVSSLLFNETTDANDSALGIAITNVDNTNGQWEWSSDNITWNDLSSSLSGSSAFLLANSDYLRFVPTARANFAGTAAISFVAWDGTSGTLHTTDDTGQAPGSGAFSSASDPATASISVVPTLSISGAATTDVAAGQDPQPFNEVTIGDTASASSDDTITVTITQQFGNGVNSGQTDQHSLNGSLSLSGANSADLVNNHNGTYTLSGSLSDVLADLQQVTFTPASPTVGTSITTKFGLGVTDTLGATGVLNDSTTVMVTNPPTIDGVNGFAAIQTGGMPSATTVSTLILGQTDPAGIGIGISAVDDSNGSWKYFNTTTNAWTAIPTETSGHVFLLSGSDQLEFVANSGFAGTSSITLVAWDENVGSDQASYTLATSPNDFSTTSEQPQLSVVPVLSIGGTASTTVAAGSTPSPFSNVSIGDNTTNTDPVTLTITLSNSANGTLAGNDLSGGAGGVYTLTGPAAQVQTDLRGLAFTPATGSAGTSTSTTFDLSLGDTLGATTVTDDSTVVVVDTPPTLTSANSFTSIPADTTSAAMQVSSLINANSSSDGVAVIGVDDSNGVWQYSTNGTSGWTAISPSPAPSNTPVSSTNAFLLGPSDYIRFESTSGASTTATITLLAWAPSNGGTALSYVNPATLPGAFSGNSAQSSIVVNPVLSILGTTTIDSTYGQTPAPAAFTGVTLSDSDSSESLTVTITQLNSGGIDTGFADGSLSLSGTHTTATFTPNSGAGTYALTDTSLAKLQADLLALVFSPTAGTPGASVTTSFQLALSDGSGSGNTFTTSATPTDTNQIMVVKSPPLLNGSNPLNPESPTSLAGTEVSALIYDPTQVTDSSDSTLGIAIIAATDNTGLTGIGALGQWEYSTAADPTDWIALPVSSTSDASNAFLLADTDNLRFVPVLGFVGTPSITFLAWDGSANTALSVDKSYNATTTTSLGAFSTVATAATSTVTVRPVLSITGTGATSINDDQQTTPFDNGTTIQTVIGDTNNSENITVLITQLNPGGIDTSLADGVLSLPGPDSADLVENTGAGPMGAGTYTLTGNAATVTGELQALVFTPNPGTVGQAVVTTFGLMVTDGPPGRGTGTPVSDSNTQVTTLSIASPTLTGANNLEPVPLNANPLINSEDPGIEVANLPAAGSSAGIGVAVSAVDDTLGTWEFSTDGTAASPTWQAISGVSSTSVLLLAPTDYIRFVPATGDLGSSTITLQAWNQFAGTVDTDNTVSPLLARGLSPTPASTATVEIVPVLSIGATHVSTSLDDQTSNPFSAVTIGDTDVAGNAYNEALTITITPTAGQANGVLTRTDSLAGVSLASFDSTTGTYTLTADNAVDAQTALRALLFTPTLHETTAGATVQTQFTLLLADSFGSANNVTDSASVLTVTADATPVLNGANPLSPIPEGASSASNPGTQVSNLISGQATDSDNDVLGIAITNVDNSNGQWSYSTGSGWIPIYDAGAVPATASSPYVVVSATSALLLAPSDSVQFAPNPGFYDSATAVLPTVQFQAWDRTVGSAGTTFDPTALPFAGAFSSAASPASASIQVVAPATIYAATPPVQTTDAADVNVFQSAFGPAGSPAPGISDANTPAQTYIVTVEIDTAANGTFEASSLTAGGWISEGPSTYQFAGTAAAANTALDALVFVPTQHQVAGGDSVTTDFTITVNDGVNPANSTVISPSSTSTPISVTATAVIDPPTFTTQPSTVASLPVLAPNGTRVAGTAAPATDMDVDPNIQYSITAGNSGGAFSIGTNGQIIVANDAALSYSSAGTVLTISAENIGANLIASAPVFTTRTIYLWEVTASATPISADSSTTLTLTLLYPTAPPPSSPSSPPPPALSVGTLAVAWGDGTTTSTTALTSATPTVSLVHFYATNPDKDDPAAAIPIAITGTDVSAQTSAAVAGTGVGIAVIPDTTSDIVEAVVPPVLEVTPMVQALDTPVSEQIDIGVAPGQATTGGERQVLLRIVSPLGNEEAGPIVVPDPDKTLNDLPGLFKNLPDGRYRVYLQQSGRSRLMIDVMVRQGQPVDAAEDSGGAGDRPPTSQSETDQAKGLADSNPPASNGNSTAQQNAAAGDNRQANGNGRSAIASRAGQPSSAPGEAVPNPAIPSQGNPGLQVSPPLNSPGPVAGHGKPTAAMFPFGLPNAGFGGGRTDAGSLPATFDRGNPNVASAGNGASGAAKQQASDVPATSLAAAVGIAAASTLASDSTRTDSLMARLSKRSLSKGARLSRRLRRSTKIDSGVE